MLLPWVTTASLTKQSKPCLTCLAVRWRLLHLVASGDVLECNWLMAADPVCVADVQVK